MQILTQSPHPDGASEWLKADVGIVEVAHGLVESILTVIFCQIPEDMDELHDGKIDYYRRHLRVQTGSINAGGDSKH